MITAMRLLHQRSQRPRLRNRAARRLSIERLERRDLLAADALAGDFQNTASFESTDAFEIGGRFETTGPYQNAIDNPHVADAPEASAANLFPTAIRIVDGNNNVITPEAGVEFWVRVEFTYDNPVNDAYSIGRIVNDNPQHLAPEITWGSGYAGRTTWNHIWGAWVMHKAGTYSVTVTVDAGGSVSESNESDNTITANFSVSGDITHEWSLVGAEQGQNLLGDGTDVIVGTMDDAFDFNHPWFTGNDSAGRPRLIASSQNTDGVGDSPVNANHATAVMGIVLAKGNNDGDITGLAPDARYVTAEFINRAQLQGLTVQDVFDAAGFLVENGAEVINMSWSWWAGSAEASYSGETSKTNLMADYLSYGLNIVAVPAVNQLSAHTRPTAPGSSRNVITTGGLRESLDRAWSQQDYGPTLDGRGKPDLLGNAAVDVVSTRSAWRDGRLAGGGFGGTSFAAPFVTGAVAQMLDYGKRTGQNTDHRTIKAIVMNSGIKSLDDDGTPWANSVSQPLDDQQGTGVLNLPRIHTMYSSGKQPPGQVVSSGYDFRDIQGTVTTSDGRNIYQLGYASAGSDLDITMAWDRHTFWNDSNSNNKIDSFDSFYVDPNDAQDNLDLLLYRDGVPVARSESMVDNVEHLHLAGMQAGKYEIHVVRRDVANSGTSESYALAWHSNGVFVFPPQVESIRINDGSPARSLVTFLKVDFDQNVDHDSLQSAFVVKNTDTGTEVGFVAVIAADGVSGTSAILTFSGTSTSARQGVADVDDSLVDGNYLLTIDASKVRAPGNLTMDSDHLFTGSANSDDFFRLFGDSDGDRDVDGQDYGRFGLTFLRAEIDQAFNGQFDYDGDGDVDGRDYGRFGSRFLKGLP